ncbi:hypothetical protein LR48_Vigan07g230900 [Vigna angularis]|uniref:Plant heme peroxidase family profile domain-containing protein n=1 Tax=Phaseolus angularis TaxID=3914 RepID=A0A0L9V0G7_PHAAN|nr:hypothetical protein LR48_Vigan07g230900 [Vigna angularis]
MGTKKELLQVDGMKKKRVKDECAGYPVPGWEKLTKHMYMVTLEWYSVPKPNFEQLVEVFGQRNFDATDVDALFGVHTYGRGDCSSVLTRTIRNRWFKMNRGKGVTIESSGPTREFIKWREDMDAHLLHTMIEESRLGFTDPTPPSSPSSVDEYSPGQTQSMPSVPSGGTSSSRGSKRKAPMVDVIHAQFDKLTTSLNGFTNVLGSTNLHFATISNAAVRQVDAMENRNEILRS